MKPIPPTPPLKQLFELPSDEVAKLFFAAQDLSDTDYLHWEKLRHMPPPAGLTNLQWWFALKGKRSAASFRVPGLRAKNGLAISISRHPVVDAKLALMDRLLAGRTAMPEAARNQATRDRYIASSLMEEAIHSSLFEGAVSTREEAKDMLRSQRAPVGRDERMILNNYLAMQRIREMARLPLTLDHVLELHSILTDGTLDKPNAAGKLQQPGEVRVHVEDHRLNRVVFEPPPAEELPERMASLIAFANADDIEHGIYIHPVLRSVLLHFQLAYDHPFYDGNGRTARALFYWSMLRREYWLAEFISISRLLYRRRHPYELAFLQVESDEQDGTYFALQQLDVLQQAVDEMFQYVERKSLGQNRLRQMLRGSGDVNHRQLALLDHALRKSDATYTHESHASSHRVSVMTARTDLLDLVGRGWLRKSRSGKRHVYVPAPGLETLVESALDAQSGDGSSHA